MVSRPLRPSASLLRIPPDRIPPGLAADRRETGELMANQAEVAAMRRALALAAGPPAPALRRSDPNPLVGCVLLDRAGRTIAEGRHEGAGTAHAEAAALAAAGPRAAGCTVVVTLEPCDHVGRTGPCTERLLAARVARLVYAQADPNPRATGGAARLAVQGLDVEGGVLAERAEQLNHVWTFAMRHQRPYVTWKFAASLDGRSAAADGTSRWLTGPAARDDVHRLRAACDAIIAGTGTVLADDSRLTARPDGSRLPAERQPLRVVVGERELPVHARVLDGAAETLHLRTRDPAQVLKELWERDRRHVLLEGGPTLAGAFLAAGLVDEVVAYLAPVLLGSGPAALGEAGITTMAGALRLDPTDVARVGPDLRVTAVPRREQAAPAEQPNRAAETTEA